MNDKTISHHFFKSYSQHILQIPMAAPTLNVLSCHKMNPFFKQSRDIFILSFPRFTICTSRVFATYPFAWHLVNFHIYFYVLSKYYHTHKGGGVLDIRLRIPYIPNTIFHLENLKINSLNSFPPKVSRYLFTLSIYNCKLEIISVSQIYI